MKITIQHLTKAFPSRNKKGQPVIAVNDMNIEIPSGKLVGLLGPSGCGKSTTLFMLSGLENPTVGRILFDEQDVTTLAPERRGIGACFPELRFVSSHDGSAKHNVPAYKHAYSRRRSQRKGVGRGASRSDRRPYGTQAQRTFRRSAQRVAIAVRW